MNNRYKYAECIGGYGELELPYFDNVIHSQAIALQSARAGLYLFLKSVNAKKLYLPNYICRSLFPALASLNITIVFYDIDANLNPSGSFKLLEDEYILLVNYFGISGPIIDNFILSENVEQSKIIIDNSQALFEPNRDCAAHFYSPRKFLGIPDGGFLYSKQKVDVPIKHYDREDAIMHLIIRSSGDEQQGYKHFLNNEYALNDFRPKLMSLLSERLIKSYNFEIIKKRRIDNFRTLDEKFRLINSCNIIRDKQIGPLCYPLKLKYDVSEIVQGLLDKKIYLPRYWPDLEGSLIAKEWYDKTLFLPVDHRICKRKIDFMINSVDEALEKQGRNYERD